MTKLLAAGATVAAFALQLGPSAAAAHTLTIYARATQAQFEDHSDDRTRGFAQNPFNADTKSLAPLTKEKEKGSGPFPGDNALYKFKLYSDAALRKNIGSAVYSCTFNFGHQAICEADFELRSGALLASGPVDFYASTFMLAVNGGTGHYLGARGQVASAPTVKDAHRLTFKLR
jgi:hypothetical protein